MPYALVYHPAVQREDIPRIDAGLRARVARAFAGPLKTAPKGFGEPLRGTLKGYWKLRVGDYRVVFQVVGQEVMILAIIHRRDVYERVAGRL